MDDNNQPLKEKKAPWRDTPLEHWSREIDPSIMSGDQWVDNQRDPGSKRRESKELLSDHIPLAPFMHPVHDVSYRDK